MDNLFDADALILLWFSSTTYIYFIKASYQFIIIYSLSLLITVFPTKAHFLSFA